MALPVPQQSHGGGCGGLGQLVMIVVAVVATISTGAVLGGVLGSALGSTAGAIATGAVAGAAGSIASQAVGIAIGAQDGFSWKSVATSALGGAVTYGIGGLSEADKLASVFHGQNWEAVAARAALSNTVTQGIGIVTGLQNGFDWRNVAASAAGAAVGATAKDYLNGNSGLAQMFKGSDIARATASAFTAGATTAIARGGKIEVARIATDAFGNALGNSLAEGISGQSSQQPQAVNAGSQSGNSNVAFGREGFGTWKAQETVTNYFEAFDQANLALGEGPPFDLDIPVPVSGGGLPSIPKVNLPGFNVMGDSLLQTGWGNFTGKFAGIGEDGRPTYAYGVVGETTGVRMTQAQKDAYDLAEYRAAVARGDVSTAAPMAPGASVARALSDAEAFFTFNPLGRFASGWAKGAYAIVHSPVDLVQGGAHLVQDAWGLSKEAMFGPERGVMGDLRPYQPKNSIVSSVLYRGGLATAGDVISDTVIGIPGVSTIDALYRRDWEGVGASVPNTALALAGGAVSSTALNVRRLDAMEGAGRLGGQLYGEEKLAKLGAYLERRGIALQVGDEYLPPGYAGGFSAGERALVLRDNPTNYEVWHELTHYQQFKSLGETAYSAQTRLMKEQYVFDKLESMPKRWNSLQPEEMSHARWYIDKVGGLW